MSKPIPAKTRKALAERSGGVCEGCGVRAATENHHRQYKSRGGSHELTNLIHLCGSGNHTQCHGVAHTGLGEARGWSVRSSFDPADVPVLIRGGWVRLSAVPGAAHERVHEADAIEFLKLIHAIKEVM